MSSRYSIKLTNNYLEVSQHNSNLLVYRTDYENIHCLDTPSLNSFIVYILFGINKSGKDKIYVGKSKNGVQNRPQSHEDKYSAWKYCYVLTQIKERKLIKLDYSD